MVVLIKGGYQETEYNGNEQSYDGYTFEEKTSTGFFNQGLVLTEEGAVTPAKGTNADTYDGKFDITKFSYNIDPNTGGNPNVTCTFEINQNITLFIKAKDISVGGKISATQSNVLTYNGNDQSAEFTVKDLETGKELTEGVDYIVTNNTKTDAGDYEATITGIGNYAGTDSASAVWTINKLPLKVNIVGDTKEVAYNGKEQVLNTYSASID